MPIICGDCLVELPKLAESSVDLLCTDPPYGLQFMGKAWDKAVPPVSVWKECLRLLKPGAFAFIMCTPRQDCLSRMIVNLQDAGFETGFTSIYWAYASGFPKAENISKAIDKNLGVERSDAISGGHRGMVLGNDYSNEKGFEYNDTVPHSIARGDISRGTPVSEQAKTLNGSYAGFQPKPAVEVIIVAIKPISEKTYVAQALDSSKGITWLDSCRIPVGENDRHEYGIDGDEGHPTVNDYGDHNRVPYEQNKLGRFPANLLVSDDVLNDGKVTKSSGGINEGKLGARIYGNFENNVIGSNAGGLGDSGSFSRYFDLDKWWEEKIKSLPESAQKTYPFLISPKASKSEKNKGCERLTEEVYNDESRLDKEAIGCNNPRNRSGTVKTMNHHPTVKSIKLMSYLVTLGSQEGDTVLDPYFGSGSTGIACKILNRNFIGIEVNPDYCKIAESRLEVWKPETKQPKLL